ncbi:LysR family transcriptional regulator [Paraferrimonas sedimenticola]|uniref:Transcriptional regulator n=1 Tax=Paraferrimonas sedimenticola TaxID=375674 RepID=A0AA37W0K1_9GAMM|nr:LysR family transcriptional regulator [Paraferrimonas sedimenticola]GLP96415.1 transcriptional regulator [Paraferrimonas sedimenticola]
MLSLEQMNMFKVAVESGSFSAAARKLNKGVSTVSTGVINLEDYLGVQLFDRSTRKPTLTQEGERLYARSKILFSEVNRIESSLVEQPSEIEPIIRIGVGELVPSSFFENQTEVLSRRFPDTRVRLERGDPISLQAGLADEQFDLVIMAQQGQVDVVFDAKGIGFVELVLVCSPDSNLADIGLVDAQTLFTQRQIACLSLSMNPLLSNALLYSPEIWETSSMEDLVKLVEQGLGWACIPMELAQERIQLGTLIEFKSNLLNAGLSIPIDLVQLAGSEAGPAKRFLIDEYLK